MSIHFICRVSINNLENFISQFNDDQEWLKDEGAKSLDLYSDAENKNAVTVTGKFKDLETAKKFFSSEESQKRMSKAGVNSIPDIYFMKKQEYSRLKD